MPPPPLASRHVFTELQRSRHLQRHSDRTRRRHAMTLFQNADPATQTDSALSAALLDRTADLAPLQTPRPLWKASHRLPDSYRLPSSGQEIRMHNTTPQPPPPSTGKTTRRPEGDIFGGWITDRYTNSTSNREQQNMCYDWFASRHNGQRSRPLPARHPAQLPRPARTRDPVVFRHRVQLLETCQPCTAWPPTG